MDQGGMDFEQRMQLFFKGIDALKERHDALTMNLELMSHEIRDIKVAAQQDGEKIRALVAAAQQDGENIRALARIAEIH
jgi:vacuolar-type H+-ATPase subunit D/Vma8